MLITAALYFAVAVFGERIETNEAHGQESGEVSSEKDNETHNETQELMATEQQSQNEIHNESNESPAQKLLEGKTEHLNETTSTQAENNEAGESTHLESNEAKEAKEGVLHQESASEKQRKNLEFPLSVAAGAGYAIVGLWMILDKRNSKLPYFIAIAGSLILLGIYVASRTVSIFSLGLEPVGLLDLVVGMLQGGIIVGSLYIVITRTYALRE